MKNRCVIVKNGKFWTGGSWSYEFPDAEKMGRRQAREEAEILDARALDTSMGDELLCNFEKDGLA